MNLKSCSFPDRSESVQLLTAGEEKGDSELNDQAEHFKQAKGNTLSHSP